MVLACMSDGLTVFDRSYRLVYMNRFDRERVRQRGLDPDSLLGKVVWVAFPDLAKRACARRLIDTMEQRVSLSFEESTNDRWFEVYLSPTEDGGVAALSRDITDRKRAEEELCKSEEALLRTKEQLEERVIQRTSELHRTVEELRRENDQRQRAESIADAERQRLDRLTELLPIGIMLISPAYHILFQNRFFRDRFGDANSSLCYELLFDRTTPCEDCNVLETNTSKYWESIDRMGRSYSIFSFPFAETNGSPVTLVVGIDMTERKSAQEQLQTANQQLVARAEQLRALLKELSRTEERQRREFAQMLHDEVQQLLVAIKFGAEYLARQITGEEQKTEVQRIIELVVQSISVTRSLTSELSPPVLHEGDFATTLHWLSRWIKERHGLEVEVQVERPAPSLPEELRIMLFQSVRELLFNVVKHSGVSKAAVNATFDEDAVHVTVEDQGKGFDPAEVPTAERGGFGLFNVRERIAILNGSVETSSSPGDGARISLHVPIPREKAPRMEAVKSLPVAIPDSPITEPGLIRVLIVDDHTVVRQGLVEILSKQPGMVVVGEAVDGQQAVEQVRDLHPTLALMDISLPKLNGIDATRIITHEFQGVRVIGLSMHTQEDVASRMQEAGAARYMSKDCPVDQLVNAIYETMNVKVQPVS